MSRPGVHHGLKVIQARAKRPPGFRGRKIDLEKEKLRGEKWAEYRKPG